MSLIYSLDRDGIRYEVRSAGRTRRLYTDGVFHSSYNPERPLTGGVWDLLMMPAFLRSPGSVERVLLLGVGGGTVIRQLREFVRPREIVAIDISAEHLDIARRFFAADGPDVKMIEADARTWLATDKSRYDLVIDDLFSGNDGEPERAVVADAAWCRKLAARLARGGAISMNCIGPAELARCGFVSDPELRGRFPGQLQLRAARDQNAVGIFLRRSIEALHLRRQLLAVPGLNPRRQSQLDFTVRALK